MARLADLLSSQTDRPVQDYTGIQGLFDVSLEWTSDDARPQPEGVPTPPAHRSTLQFRNNSASSWNRVALRRLI